MTHQEIVKFIEHQARTVAHLHGLEAAKDWLTIDKAVKELVEEYNIARENLDYYQQLYAREKQNERKG